MNTVTITKNEHDRLINLAKMATTDPLTMVGNRLAFDNRRKKSSREFLWLLDLDGLKIINDTQGHLAGDEYLKQATEALKQVFKRDSDLIFQTVFDDIFRIGGDEFVVITDREFSQELIKKSLPMFSVGVAEIIDGRLEDALRLADDHMYCHKRSKKNSIQ